MSRPVVYNATTKDLDIIQRLGRQTFLETFAEDNTAEDILKYVDESFSREKVKQEFANPKSEFFLCAIEQEPIGYLKLNFGDAQTENHDKNAVEIERIYVLSAYQGKQVGKLLFHQALDIAKEKKATYLWLGVWEKNLKAIKFYHKLGFMAFDKHQFMLGNDRQTDILMQLEVTSGSSVK